MTLEPLQFREMNAEEFEEFIERQQASYPQEIARNYKRPIEEVRVEAKEQFKQLLPDGIKTAGHSFLQAVDTETGKVIGSVWVKEEAAKKRAFLFYIRVQEDYRGKGYGKRMLGLLGTTLLEKGINSLALHVFADNQIAINLYKKQGFEIASYNMQKSL